MTPTKMIYVLACYAESRYILSESAEGLCLYVAIVIQFSWLFTLKLQHFLAVLALNFCDIRKIYVVYHFKQKLNHVESKNPVISNLSK